MIDVNQTKVKISAFDGSEPWETQCADSVEDVTLSELADVICMVPWSPGVFKNIDFTDSKGNQKHGYRRVKDNLDSIDLVSIDIDEGLTIEEAEEIIRKNGFFGIVATTRNHRKEKITSGGTVKPPCDRMRAILAAERRMSSTEYSATLQKAFELFPMADASCKDPSRFYFKCR